MTKFLAVFMTVADVFGAVLLVLLYRLLAVLRVLNAESAADVRALERLGGEATEAYNKLIEGLDRFDERLSASPTALPGKER